MRLEEPDTKVRGEIIDDDVAKAEVDNVTAGGFFQCFGREQEPGRSIPRLSFPLGVHAAGILGGRSSEQDRLAAANPASLPHQPGHQRRGQQMSEQQLTLVVP